MAGPCRGSARAAPRCSSPRCRRGASRPLIAPPTGSGQRASAASAVRLEPSHLAPRAEEGGALRLDEPPEGRAAAARATLALPAVDEERVLRAGLLHVLDLGPLLARDGLLHRRDH